MNATRAQAGGAGGTDEPARSDPFVGGLSQLIGGPLGDHAARARPTGGRFWTAARVVLALVCLTLTVHYLQKSPCRDGAWVDFKQYRQLCYTDVLALYYAEGLDQGKVPYRDHPVEYPVLTGAFMGMLGLPVHALGRTGQVGNEGQAFYDANALVLGALGVATAGLLLGLRRRRPWDVAMFAVSPALLLTATVNWDLLAVALAVAGLYAWAKRRPLAAGVLLGLGGAAKLWPLFLLGPVLLLGLRGRRWGHAAAAAGAGVVTWVLVNAPVYLLWPRSWQRFSQLNWERPVDWGTLWYIGNHVPRGGGRYGVEPFNSLAGQIPTLNVLTYVLMGAAFAGIAALALLAPRRPRLAQLAFLTVAAFLIFNKVWSQQFVLWLLPLAVLARPRWGAFLAWQAAEVGYFLAFYGELLGASGRPIFPEGVFVLAASLRLVTVLVLCGFVVRDILRPERDAVRQTYPDDPDGGVLDGAPDAPWVAGLTRQRRPPAAGEGPRRTGPVPVQ